LKLNKVKNADIASEINKKWNKTYTVNYISTIFRQRIIPRINAAAAYHVKLLENIYFEEEFKTCSSCGRVLLKDTENFTRRARSKDGFSGTCKVCEKASRTNRQIRKEEQNNDTE
jgi:RNase P subunit RPR2